MAEKKRKLKLKRGFFITFLKKAISLFKHKVEIVNLSGDVLPDKAIYLSNHAGANGPMTYEMYFPRRITCWGAHEMCEGFKSRWNYLYHVFYRQKLHWGKVKAFIVASLFAPVSKLFYDAVGLIPTYRDTRFISTVKHSVRILDEDSSLLIFPEDSDEGYKNPPDDLHNGFVAFSNIYRKIRNTDVPIFPCYFLPEKHKIIVTEPINVNKMKSEGLSDDEIKNCVLDVMQNVYREYC